MDKKKKIVVLGIIENEDRQILLSQRIDPKIPAAHLKWDVPGGTNEFGESLKETLTREVFEETGLNIEILELMPDCVSKEWKHEDYLQHTLVFCYHCKFINGKMNLKDHKINALRWMPPKEASKLDLLPTTKIFIDLYIKNNFKQ